MATKFNRGLLQRNIFKPGQKFYVSLAHTEEDLQYPLQVLREVAPELRQQL